MQEIYGDPDLYISFQDKATASPHVGTGQWAYRAISQDGVDQIIIPPGASQCNAPTAAGCYCASFPCAVQIAIYGFIVESSYLVTAQTSSSDASTQLVDGRASTGSVPNGHYAFYKFRVASDSVTELTFTLTPTIGDPDIFVSDTI